MPSTKASHRVLSNSVIIYVKNYLDWYEISECQVSCFDMIWICMNRVNGGKKSSLSNIVEQFYYNHGECFNIICKYQVNENFIHNYRDELGWDLVIKYQYEIYKNISKQFVKDY